jgi:cytochrome c oxidase assembly protein subunit 15
VNVEPWLRRLTLANLVANILIVVTGGAVRLTGSGLGCPTWPKCTDESYVVHGALGIHGAIEFGNRSLTFVLAILALALLVTAILWLVQSWQDQRPWRAFVLSLLVFLGIPAQAVIGGITVRTHLNPWIVSFHLLVSMAIIGVCVVLDDHLRGPSRPRAAALPARLSWLVFASGAVVLYLGTIVTGSGPHSGDLDSRRTGLDPHVLSHVHEAAVWVLVAATVGLLVALRRQTTTPEVRRAVELLLVIELAQGAVGYTQYFLGLPELVVGLHMLGAALVAAGLARVAVNTRER